MKRFALLTVLLVSGARALGQTTPPAPSPLASYLTQMDSLFRDVPGWLWNLYEPTSGGFYENIAMRRQPYRFGPDIQSTTQALGLLTDCGLPANALPDSVRRAVIRYFQTRQDPETGFFSDPHYPQARQSERLLGRMMGFSRRSLEQLGAAPLYRLPSGQVGPSGLLTYYASPQALNAWLDSLSWKTNVWKALDAISSQNPLLRTLPDAQRTRYARQMHDYALARQDADGLWGNGQAPLVRLSGTVKFAWFCRDSGLPLPHADRIYRTLLAWYRTEPSKADDFKLDTCFPGNTIGLLGELTRYLPQPFPPDDIALVLRESVRMMRAFRTPDGGFCRHVGRYYARPNDLAPHLAQFDEPVGDVNGTSQLSRVRRWAYELAQVPLSKLDSFQHSGR